MILEPEPAASAARDSRDSPTETNLNPKVRLLMQSASSIASGTGQQREKRSVADTEPGMQTGGPLESALVNAQRCLVHCVLSVGRVLLRKSERIGCRKVICHSKQKPFSHAVTVKDRDVVREDKEKEGV